MIRRNARLGVVSGVMVAAFCCLVWFGFELGTERSANPSIWIEANAPIGATNLVSTIYLGARLFDTVLEVLVFAVAVLGVRHYLEEKARQVSTVETLPESHVVRVSAHLLLPLITLLGIYVTVFGHLSPGGGFSGGVIVASGVLLVAIALGPHAIGQRIPPERLEWFEWIALLMILAIVLIPAVAGDPPLSGILPPGQFGRLYSGGDLLPLNLLIGAKVFIGSWGIIHHFLQHRGEI